MATNGCTWSTSCVRSSGNDYLHVRRVSSRVRNLIKKISGLEVGAYIIALVSLLLGASTSSAHTLRWWSRVAQTHLSVLSFHRILGGRPATKQYISGIARGMVLLLLTVDAHPLCPPVMGTDYICWLLSFQGLITAIYPGEKTSQAYCPRNHYHSPCNYIQDTSI